MLWPTKQGPSWPIGEGATCERSPIDLPIFQNKRSPTAAVGSMACCDRAPLLIALLVVGVPTVTSAWRARTGTDAAREEIERGLALAHLRMWLGVERAIETVTVLSNERSFPGYGPDTVEATLGFPVRTQLVEVRAEVDKTIVATKVGKHVPASPAETHVRGSRCRFG